MSRKVIRRPLLNYSNFCTPPEAEVLQTILDAVTQLYPSLRSPVKILGKGAYGLVVLFDSNVVVKFMIIPSNRYNALGKSTGVKKMIKNEQKLQNMFVDHSLAPVIRDTIIDIHHNFENNDTYVYGIIMDPIQMTLDQAIHSLDCNDISKTQKFLCFFIESFIGSVLPTMIKNKLIHGDMHTGNVALSEPPSYTGLESIDMTLIDFGMSRVAITGAENFVDLIPLLGNLNYTYQNVILERSLDIFHAVLIDTLVKAANTMFNIRLNTENIRPGPRGGFEYLCKSRTRPNLRLYSHSAKKFYLLYMESQYFEGFEHMSGPTSQTMRDALKEAKVNCLEFTTKLRQFPARSYARSKPIDICKK